MGRHSRPDPREEPARAPAPPPAPQVPFRSAPPRPGPAPPDTQWNSGYGIGGATAYIKSALADPKPAMSVPFPIQFPDPRPALRPVPADLDEPTETSLPQPARLRSVAPPVDVEPPYPVDDYEPAPVAVDDLSDDDLDADEDADEAPLLLQWGAFVLQTVLAGAAGVGIWLGFYKLWSGWPFYAAAAVGVAIVGMLVVAGFVRRRYGHELDLLTTLLTVAVGVVLTVLPAAFSLQTLP